MTIRRIKRPERPIGAGRPRKLSTPPSSIGGPSIVLELIRPKDVQDLAVTTGHPPASDDLASAVAADINEAFSDYANAARMQIDDSPAAERRNWCVALARIAADLHRGLGHTEDSLFMEAAAFDAAGTLRKGWPADSELPTAQALQDLLSSALSFALPDKYPDNEAQEGTVFFDDSFWSMLSRLGPALHALSLVAGAAGTAWGAEVGLGNGNRDLGRHHLMTKLVPAFVRLFGHVPTTAPGSPGFRWFSALLTKAGQLAREWRQRAPALSAEDEKLLMGALQSIEALAEHISPPPYQTQTKGTAKLDHWLREGITTSGMRQSKADIETPALSAREPTIEIHE